jgi:hypothetical protein
MRDWSFSSTNSYKTEMLLEVKKIEEEEEVEEEKVEEEEGK